MLPNKALVIGCLLLASIPAGSAIIPAASCSRADVLAAYNAAANGDTISIPAGDCVTSNKWTSYLKIQKQVTFQGQGAASTKIGISARDAGFQIYADQVRLTGMMFDCGNLNTSNAGIVLIGDSSVNPTYTFKDFRIDHNTIDHCGGPNGDVTGYEFASIFGFVYGVIDHNTFNDCNGECLDICADGAQHLNRSLAFGQYTNGTIFVEDNTFNATRSILYENLIDGNSQQRFTFRHNTINIADGARYASGIVSTHETCVTCTGSSTSGGDAGSATYEMYENTINLNNTGRMRDLGIVRSGRALIYNNHITGTNLSSSRYDVASWLSNYRSYAAYGDASGYCSSAANPRGYSGACHEVDGSFISEGLETQKTTLASAISATQATIPLTSLTGLSPNGGANGFAVRVDNEQIDYTGISGNQLTGVVRGANGTTAAAHAAGAGVDYLKFGTCLEQVNNVYIWNNEINGVISGAMNNIYICDLDCGGVSGPDYTHYDIQSFSQRPANWQYQTGTAFAYTPYPYPHPLVTGTPPPPPSGPAFPVKASSNQRYLVDQNNVPFPILGRTAWFVISNSVADYQTFIQDTVARNFTAIEMHVLDHDSRGKNPPYAGNGSLPFLKQINGANWDGGLNRTGTTAPDFTTTNEAFWTYVDDFLNYCESKGLIVFFFPAYVGYQGGSQGWMQELVANGPTRINTYGAFLSNRYKNQKNLVWMMGGDMGTAPNAFNSAQTAVENALITGLKSVQPQQSTFFSAEWDSESIGTDQTSFGTQMTLNGAYSHGGDVNTQCRRAYAHAPISPSYLIEGAYDQEGPPDGAQWSPGNWYNSSATQPVRRFQWWSMLSSIEGYITGNGFVWPFSDPNWKAHLDTQGSRDLGRQNAFMKSIAWYELVPSGLGGMKTLVTTGGGTVSADNYVSASANPTGTLLVAYVPPAHSVSITVDMTAMSASAQARWFDPTNAAYTTISGSPFANTGTRAFTPPGNNSVGEHDWVLLLQTMGIPPSSACDINSDGTTNVSDVQLCVNQAVGVTTCSTGDINHDFSCNVIDVQRVVNTALGGQCVTQ